MVLLTYPPLHYDAENKTDTTMCDLRLGRQFTSCSKKIKRRKKTFTWLHQLELGDAFDLCVELRHSSWLQCTSTCAYEKYTQHWPRYEYLLDDAIWIYVYMPYGLSLFYANFFPVQANDCARSCFCFIIRPLLSYNNNREVRIISSICEFY